MVAGAQSKDQDLIAQLRAVALHSKLAAPVAILAAERLEVLTAQQQTLAEYFGVPLELLPRALERLMQRKRAGL